MRSRLHAIEIRISADTIRAIAINPSAVAIAPIQVEIAAIAIALCAIWAEFALIATDFGTVQVRSRPIQGANGSDRREMQDFFCHFGSVKLRTDARALEAA